MIEHLPTGTEVTLELADGTVSTFTTNGNNLVSDEKIVADFSPQNLSKVTVTTPEGVTEYSDLIFVQNRKFGDEYMLCLREKTTQEKEKEELLQLMADLTELTLEVLSDG